MRRREDKYWKDKGGMGFKDMIPGKIAIIKLYLNPSRGSWYEYNGFKHGYVTNEEVERWMDDKSIDNWKEHLKKERIAYNMYGDQIKYNNHNEIEWVFSPRYCWYELPEEARNEITANYLSWDFYGEYYSRLHPSWEPNVGHRNTFFRCSIEKGQITWRFTRDDHFAGEAEPFKFV
jgi:hypothetical protein